MVNQRTLFGAMILALGLLALYYRAPPPVIGEPTPTDRSQLRSQWYQQGQENSSLVYYQDAHPSPKAVMAQDEINALLADSPTAAGLKPLLELQYHAASQGKYQDAMRLMAESFLQERGSGSYQQSW